MAKKYYDEDIKSMSVDWGGDESTNNLPVAGNKVQKFIKDSINTKVGYVDRVDTAQGGFYVLARDKETFDAYVKTITDDKPFGDIDMDGIDGRRFDAPFNYKMSVTLLDPEEGYKSTLVGSTNNVIKFKAETQDSSGAPIPEGVTVTFRIVNESGLETTKTMIYPYAIASRGIEYNLDGKLSSGENTINVTVVGNNTGVSTMRRIVYRMIDMTFGDRFDIARRYQFTDNGTLAINLGYALKGIGKTQLEWYFDGNLYETEMIANHNPLIANGNKTFHFTQSTHTWLTPGVHTLQVAMSCTDTESGEVFHTPIYYREFIIENTPTVLNTPYITRKAEFPYENGFLGKNDNIKLYNVQQYENFVLQYAAYYNGKNSCDVEALIQYGTEEPTVVVAENLPLVLDGFSEIQDQIFPLNNSGNVTIILRAVYGDEYYEVKAESDVKPSDMVITTPSDNVVLDLNAFGQRTENVWEYVYLDAYGQEQKITTEFSQNRYVVISTRDVSNNVVPPYDATEENTLDVDTIPPTENEDYKYLRLEGEYYIWEREFDWSNTSGWSDNKLKLANGNAITINYQPFSNDKLLTIKEQGMTLEFEFETTNVYNDDAVICRICGNDNFAPGISIYASGAELVISRAAESEGINAGYSKAVSTKYKAEENNRISFVITPDSDDEGYYNRILSIYVNGEYCGAYAYSNKTVFANDSKITFRGSEDACVNISSIKIYSRELSSDEILSNYIYYRTNSEEKREIYKRNDIVLATQSDKFDSDKLKSQLPVMTFYQILENEDIDQLHQEKKNKKLAKHFDIVYTDIQNPHKNFVIKNAYVTPQGTSSMSYPVKNFRIYTKKDDTTRLYVGSNIFINPNSNSIEDDNLNPDALVSNRKYAFKDNSIPVNCWCLKADFAESSSSHNTGTARFWNSVLKNSGLKTKAQLKAEKYQWGETMPDGNVKQYDVRTCIDGFPIVLFYQPLDGSSPRFEGKYNFNNDKSTEDVFGFTGGMEIKDQEVVYYYIGKEMPIIHYDSEKGKYACSFERGGYTTNPTEDSPLYASEILDSYEKPVMDPETGEQMTDQETGELVFETVITDENWYMLRGKELLDNPKMECWELLNSINDIALFKTMKGFGYGDGDEKVGIVDGESFQEAFESRYPDCGDYYHSNTLRRFGEWLVSCRYLTIDNNTGKAVPYSQAALPTENYYKNSDGLLSIQNLSKKSGTVVMDFPGKNFYKVTDYQSIASSIRNEGYQQISLEDDVIDTIEYLEVDTMPTEKNAEYEYIKFGELFYTWMPSNVLYTDTLPEYEETSYAYVCVGKTEESEGTYYFWDNKYNLETYHTIKWVEDTPFNRALKFAIEKWDHIEMDKMAAYYVYLMRFGGVDQTVKNAMLTTEGPATDDPNSLLPSLWYFINYDNDTILGVKNDGHLVFGPYITRETKDGQGYVYAGRESTLWNNLEADVEFMKHVTTIDNRLADAGTNASNSLSYANALREYDVNQSDKWCERIYNKDAERKYIDTFVVGWKPKEEKGDVIVGGTEAVHENFLYDVHGSRSAHRKWWLGRRFNVYDSKFGNSNFKSSMIRLRSTNLPVGSHFTIESGEPVFYAWGNDNSVVQMTPHAIQPGDTFEFTTKSTFNIGSYLEIYGAANVATLDIRDCVGSLNVVELTGCYSPLIGTKLKKVYVGDHTRDDLINVGNTSLTVTGLERAEKLEELDMTNIQNADSLDGLSKLVNIREVYARGTIVTNFVFADGAMIEKIELPTTVENLSLTRSSMIKYENIVFEDGKYGKLRNLTIDECPNLMNDYTFVLNWIASVNENDRARLSLNLQGINWLIDSINFEKIFLLEQVGKVTGVSSLNIRGNIEFTERLDPNTVSRLKKLFGQDCFKEGSKVYIKAPTDLYVSIPGPLWEGDGDVKCDITAVGTKLDGTLSVTASVTEVIDGKDVTKILEATDGIITMDMSELAKDYVTLNILESPREFKLILITATYRNSNGSETTGRASAFIKKRIYPSEVSISTTSNSFNDKYRHPMTPSFLPEEINDPASEGRGIFNVHWEMIDGSSKYQDNVTIIDPDNEVAQIVAPGGYDGKVVVQVTVTRDYDDTVLCTAQKSLEFTNPETIITRDRNEAVYEVLLANGLIEEDETGYGYMTKSDAAMLTMEDMISKSTGKSIFEGNTKITSFLEFQYFNIGQMPVEGSLEVVTPDRMFANCSKLEKIAFSSNFRYTANEMFLGCGSLKAIYGPERVDGEGNLIEYDPVSFDYIGEKFCSGCGKLEHFVTAVTTRYIGANAFTNCGSLYEFRVPTTSELVMGVTSSDTPFTGCRNISFNGAIYGEGSAATYQVKDGALYGIRKDGAVDLIHMGKNTLTEQIVKDVTVYARAQSMEYRTESNIVVPENIVFDGNKIFSGSVGESVTLTNLLQASPNAKYLFIETNYNGNYKFLPTETYIPESCFSGLQGCTPTFTLPYGIKEIGQSAFYGTSVITELVFPETVEKIGASSFWLMNGLKTLRFLGEVPPTIEVGDFFNVMLENIYVPASAYETYKNTLKPYITPFVTPATLYETGYVRIIKDGAFVVADEQNVVTVGGHAVVQNVDYMMYESDGENTNRDITLNGEVVGKVTDLYTTVYLGDNSSLFTGEGFDFTRCAYDATVVARMEEAGWFYDPRFHGIRSKVMTRTGDGTELTFDVPNYADKPLQVTYGIMSHNKATGYISDTTGEQLFKMPAETDTQGYDLKAGFMCPANGKIVIGFTKSNIATLVDGVIVNKIGNATYSDPEIPAISTLTDDMNNTNISLFTVNLEAEQEIPVGTTVTVTDGITHTYSKNWEGQPLMFVLPAGFEFTVEASAFVTEDGKYFGSPEPVKVTGNEITISYRTDLEMTLDGDILLFKTSDTDYFINLDIKENVWGPSGVETPEVSTSEIVESVADGYHYTTFMYGEDPENQMFADAYNWRPYGYTVRGYIPSYLDVLVVCENLDNINAFLKANGKDELTLDSVWVSEAFDADNAWTSDGETAPKDEPHRYVVFGKRIIL